MGNFHQASPHIFKHIAAGSQCTSICLAAIIASSYKKVENWDSKFLDSLLLGGDKLHLNILQTKQWPNNRSDSRLDIDEIPENIKCQIGNEEVYANIDVRNSSYGYSSYLEALLTTALCSKVRQHFILRMHGYCLTILFRGHQQYSIFDPHAKNSFGSVDPHGTAGLFHFNSVEKMVTHLKKCTPPECVEQIDLYPVHVNLLRKSTIECELQENSTPTQCIGNSAGSERMESHDGRDICTPSTESGTGNEEIFAHSVQNRTISKEDLPTGPSELSKCLYLSFWIIL
jgi:hypothetical protein